MFNLVERLETMRLVVAINSSMNWPLNYLDAKFDFLNGRIENIVYVTQPPEFKVKGKECMLYKLHKSLYKLK